MRNPDTTNPPAGFLLFALRVTTRRRGVGMTIDFRDPSILPSFFTKSKNKKAADCSATAIVAIYLTALASSRLALIFFKSSSIGFSADTFNSMVICPLSHVFISQHWTSSKKKMPLCQAGPGLRFLQSP